MHNEINLRERVMKIFFESIDYDTINPHNDPLYTVKDKISAFNKDAELYKYWIIKTSKWYDPEGISVPSKYDIRFAADTEVECRNKLKRIKEEALLSSDRWNRVSIERETRDSITIYYPGAIAKATFTIIKNPTLH